MSRPPRTRAAPIRQLPIPEPVERHRTLGLEFVHCDVERVYVEEDAQSFHGPAPSDAGKWTPGRVYRVHGLAHNLNTHRLDVVFLLADDEGRLHHIHIDHTRVAEEDE